ncbi:MAG: hypothetical protein ACYSUT_07415 [Planctomycetota bacterium]|jgi:hypothetical protein
MRALAIDVEQMQTAFLPGQRISGTASWMGEKPPKKAAIRLVWFTQGRGTEDAGIIDSLDLDLPQTTDERSFEFHLPAGPYSFSGTLVSLTWALELEVDRECERAEIVVSPSGEEIKLGRHRS